MQWEEFTAKNVDEALDLACDKYVKTSDEIEFEVIEEGSNGLLGLFSKPAKIRARIKSEENKTVTEREVVKSEPVKKEAPKIEVKKENAEVANVTQEEKEDKPAVEVDEKLLISAAENFLKKVCEQMEIEATFEITCDKEESRIDVNIVGKDMGLLIGKRGQTLDSLQYLTSLVVNKESGTYFKVKLDTENYRARRKETLENLARNISSKVKKTRKSVALEPMNPYERRIIHSALQNDKYVETYSEGEEPNRKVVIAMKKEFKNSYNKSGGYNKKYNNRNYKKGGYSRGGYGNRTNDRRESKPVEKESVTSSEE